MNKLISPALAVGNPDCFHLFIEIPNLSLSECVHCGREIAYQEWEASC